MAAENEIVRLALGGISLLASIIDNYVLPNDMQKIIRFTMSSFAELSDKEDSVILKKKIEPKSYLSKDALALQIVTALWHILSIGRIYNGLYLKGKKPRDFIRETISYDKELRKEGDNG